MHRAPLVKRPSNGRSTASPERGALRASSPGNAPPAATALRHDFARALPSTEVDAVQPLQRTIDVEKFFDKPEKRQQLFAAGIGIDDLEEIQELMQDRTIVEHYLLKLESAMQGFFGSKKAEAKYTRALDMALYDVERRWMNVPLSDRGESQKVDYESNRPFDAQWQGVPEVDHGTTSKAARETIPQAPQAESQKRFVERIRTVKPLKDVGAAISHGEYAHRIQWYIIAQSAFDGGSVSPRWVRSLYAILGAEEFIQDIEAYKTPSLPEGWALWGAVVDVPYSISTEGAKSGADVAGPVGFSAPVAVTKHISEGQRALQYSQLQLAVLNRRLKRYYEGIALNLENRGDLALKRMLKDLPVKMKDRQDFAEVRESIAKLIEKSDAGNGQIPGYDARNAIAFALSGIPSSPGYVEMAMNDFEAAQQ
jgi:Family of unknown function (DUF5636)